MAQGVDLWAAHIIADLKRAYPTEDIELIAAIPFMGQKAKWSDKYKNEYRILLNEADEEIYFKKLYR